MAPGVEVTPRHVVVGGHAPPSVRGRVRAAPLAPRGEGAWLVGEWDPGMLRGRLSLQLRAGYLQLGARLFADPAHRRSRAYSLQTASALPGPE